MRGVVFFVVVVGVCLFLRSKRINKADTVLKSAGRKVEEFKIGRIHGFVDDSNKIYAQDGSLLHVNVIDLTIASQYGFFQVKKDVNKHVLFMQENRIGIGAPMRFLTLGQVEEFYQFAKKYAPELEYVGRVHSIYNTPL